MIRCDPVNSSLKGNASFTGSCPYARITLFRCVYTFFEKMYYTGYDLSLAAICPSAPLLIFDKGIFFSVYKTQVLFYKKIRFCSFRPEMHGVNPGG
jgi:hypothetical protein